ncbi:hypothetical protein HMPREF1602_00700 [Escherichia coli 907889]|nr:hypothetical protein HMPREF1602_00700 [Escherichia coli 907889]
MYNIWGAVHDASYQAYKMCQNRVGRIRRSRRIRQ